MDQEYTSAKGDRAAVLLRALGERMPVVKFELGRGYPVPEGVIHNDVVDLVQTWLRINDRFDFDRDGVDDIPIAIELADAMPSLAMWFSTVVRMSGLHLFPSWNSGVDRDKEWEEWRKSELKKLGAVIMTTAEELRLYTLRKGREGKPVAGLYFSDKHSAKLARNERNRVLGHNQYVVSYGPDHKKWRGE